MFCWQGPWDLHRGWEAPGVSSWCGGEGEQTHLCQTTQVAVNSVNCIRGLPLLGLHSGTLILLPPPTLHTQTHLHWTLHRYNGEVGDVVVGRIIEVVCNWICRTHLVSDSRPFPSPFPSQKGKGAGIRDENLPYPSVMHSLIHVMHYNSIHMSKI